MNDVLALILAGGLGQRMGILCDSRPKPMLPFACRYSIIDFTLSNCIHSGIKDIAVLVDHQRQLMSHYVSHWQHINSVGIGLQTLEPQSGSYRGTADAIYQNIDLLRRLSPEITIVLAGDHVYRMDYREMLTLHKKAGADVTIGAVSVPVKQAHRFGIIKLDNCDRVIDFVEKPLRPNGNLASMGIYLFNTDFLIQYLIKDSTDPYSKHDFGRTLIPDMVHHNKVFAYQFRDYWQDIGTVDAYYGANMELVRNMPPVSLNGHWPIMTNDYNVRPPMLVNSFSIRNSLIGEGCIVEGEVENSILFPNVTVKEHSSVRNSIVMSRTVIDSYTTVDHAVLDENVILGQFCYIGYVDVPIQKEKGVTVLGKGAVVPDYTAIRSNSRTTGGSQATVSVTCPVPCRVRRLDKEEIIS